MKLGNLITEIATDLSIAYPFEKMAQRADPAERFDRYRFSTGGSEYLVKFFTPYPASQYMEGTIEREYGVYGEKNITADSLTGENKAIRVNATVMAITLQWINEHPDFTLMIIRPMDIRRFNIVKLFIDSYLGGKYDITYGENGEVIRIKNMPAIRALRNMNESMQEIDELAIKLKPLYGFGSSHNIYSTNRYPDRLIKIEKQPGEVDRWYELFIERPDIFAKTYGKGSLKLKDKNGVINNIMYVMVEKLETKPFLQLWMHIEQHLDNYSRVIDAPVRSLQHYINEYLFNEGDSSDELWNGFMDYIRKTNGADYVRLNVFLNLLNEIYELKPSGDVHKDQFGYDDNGNLKCLDI